MEDHELFSGLIRLHILYHASQGPIFGLWIIRELERHGYRLSPGTLYPILHGMEKRGYLVSGTEEAGGRRRRVYRITEEGRRVLVAARIKVRELFGELFAEGPDGD
ncbi:MAG: PadR family transcriptional regulator [Desulfotomaculales bacterium]